MKRLICFVCLVVLLCSGVVWAQSVPAPDVIKGKFVYTVPANFDPPLIGKSGIGEIQDAAEKLHFPYYVVLVEQFDGETDDDAAAVIDNLVEKWQEDPDFNSSKSCVFLLSYSPRKYRFLAGSKWEVELGFSRDAHAPYTSIFEGYVQSARKDPQTGIIEMMKAVDDYLFAETDPATIAQRKEAERKAEIARAEAEKKARAEAELQSARSQLSDQISMMDSLLAVERRFLPADTDKYAKARNAAYETISGNDPTPILDEAAGLRVQVRELQRYVEARQAEAREASMRALARVTCVGAVLVALLIWIVARFRRLGSLRRDFQARSGHWEDMILNAQPKYLNFEREREMIFGLRELSGRTKELYDTTTREVDAIFITIAAIQNRIDACKLVAAQGSFRSLRPLERAISDLQSEFTVDTNQIGRVELFAPEVRQVTLEPAEALGQLEERFRVSIDQWEHLRKAAEIRYQQAEDIFPQTKLDEMIEAADKHDVPHRWLADHPLFGDDESDRTLYTRINEGRANDPVAFLERIEELQRKESEIAGRLERLVESVTSARSMRVDSVPNLDMTVLQPQDDPAITFDTARREEARFAAFLASRDDVAEIEAQAAEVQGLYRKCVEQTVMAQTAISLAQQEVEKAQAQLASLLDMADTTARMVADREHIHSNLNDAKSSLNNGRRFLDAGRADVDASAVLLSERRHLDAETAARRAERSLDSARKEFENCRRICEELDEAKRRFEERIADLDSRREEFAGRIVRYGGSPVNLQRYGHLSVGPVADYLLLLRQLDSLEASWEGEVRRARREYEEAERRRREAEEAAERRRRQFSSSSSGSSFGSSSSHSSSSGGSSGSSSSRSSSSGGSW